MKKLDDLKNRFFVSTISIIVCLLLIIFSNIAIMKPIVTLAICIIATIAAFEYIHIIKAKKIKIWKPLFLGAVILQIVAFFVFSQYPQMLILPVLVGLLFFIGLFLYNFREIDKAIIKISSAALGFMYIAIPFGMLLPILYLNSFQIQDGRLWLLYTIFVTKITDIGAYFGGRLFGKRKLAPNISPNKTIFGAVSGLVFALLGSMSFLIFSNQNAFNLNMIEAIIMGLVLGVVAQFGDLSESLLKRDADIKDSSTIPGIGGILDMVDSLMFNIPIMFIYLIG